MRDGKQRLRVHVQTQIQRRRARRALALRRKRGAAVDRAEREPLEGDARLDVRDVERGGERVREGDGRVRDVVRVARRREHCCARQRQRSSLSALRCPLSVDVDRTERRTSERSRVDELRLDSPGSYMQRKHSFYCCESAEF